ncbi:MAG: H(+)-transporting V1 sector ATPase subunit F [Phylliscum demangeonii]|nr:MAG: H(+)-transporting V1 sector ATPase subunit F [Phylliscum demangeonii]
MAAVSSSSKSREFLAVIGDEVSIHRGLGSLEGVRLPDRRQDTVTGMLLAGIGHVTPAPDAQKNFLVVDSRTENTAIEQAFDGFTVDRKDIGVLLINQHVADRIRARLDAHTAAFPAVVEIPSKDHPYDPEKDSVLRRVRKLFGE